MSYGFAYSMAGASAKEHDLGLSEVLLEGGVQARALQRQQLRRERHVRAHRRRLLLLALPQVRIQALRMRSVSPYNNLQNEAAWKTCVARTAEHNAQIRQAGRCSSHQFPEQGANVYRCRTWRHGRA